MEAAVKKEEQMLTDYGFSISAGNIIESSHTSSFSSSSSSSSSSQYPPTNANMIFNHVKITNPEASNSTRGRGRKKINSQTQTVKTTNLTDDGYGWRKYGQKIIHNTIHPKSYYKCTNHKEEKCEAKKWVQQESENPPIYKTTYLGHHTCKNPHRIPQIFFPYYSQSSANPSMTTSSKPVLIRFDSPTPSPHVSNINGDRHEQQTMKACDTGLNSASSPPSIWSWSDDDSMMLFDDQGGPEIDTYPSIPSPNCSFESYELDMMIQELQGPDNVEIMQEYW